MFRCLSRSPKRSCGLFGGRCRTCSISSSVRPRAPAAVMASAVSMLNGEKKRLPGSSCVSRLLSAPPKRLIPLARAFMPEHRFGVVEDRAGSRAEVAQERGRGGSAGEGQESASREAWTGASECLRVAPEALCLRRHGNTLPTNADMPRMGGVTGTLQSGDGRQETGDRRRRKKRGWPTRSESDQPRGIRQAGRLAISSLLSAH